MSFDWASIAVGDIAPLIEELGKAVTIRRVTGGTYDPLAGSFTGGSTADTPSFAVFDEITDEYSEKVGGNNITGEDRLLLIAGTYDVDEKDKIVDGTDVWSIVRLGTVNPGGVKLLYEVQVRP